MRSVLALPTRSHTAAGANAMTKMHFTLPMGASGRRHRACVDAKRDRSRASTFMGRSRECRPSGVRTRWQDERHNAQPVRACCVAVPSTRSRRPTRSPDNLDGATAQGPPEVALLHRRFRMRACCQSRCRPVSLRRPRTRVHHSPAASNQSRQPRSLAGEAVCIPAASHRMRAQGASTHRKSVDFGPHHREPLAEPIRDA